MQNPLSIDLLALLSIIFLSAALVGTLAGYMQLRRKLLRLQLEEDTIKAKAHQKAQAILETAQDAAFQIANESVIKAEETRQHVKAKLEEVATKQLREYQKMVHQASGDIEQEVAKTIELKMDTAFAEAEKEVAAYKNQKTADIDARADLAIKKVTKEVLGRALNLSDHTDLVMRALETAKREYGF